MGLYDRDYYRREPQGFSFGAPHSVVNRLILVNVLVWLADQVLFDGVLDKYLAATPGTLTHPWLWWQFITYGFLHANEPAHIIFNMLALWMFGRDIEAVYGGKEFFKLYMVLLAAGSVGWAIANRLMGASPGVSCVGASAAVTGVVVLYIFHYPHRTLLFMFVLPVPAWLVGVLMIGYDVMGAMGNSNVAHGAHLAGAAVAFAYFRLHWNFTDLLHRLWQSLPGGGRPRLRVHQPQPDKSAPSDELSREVDRILEKIHNQGEASLTRQERQVLENASRQYQQRRQP